MPALHQAYLARRIRVCGHQADEEGRLRRVDDLRLVIAGGGSPCQGLSQLSSQRTHFRDERSGLFFVMADHLETIDAICKERDVKFLGLLENVVMDEEDRNDISYRLGWMPNLAESGEVSSVRRPRLYWLNRHVPQMPWMTVDRQEVACSLKLSGPVEPDELWMPEGYSWSVVGPTLIAEEASQLSHGQSVVVSLPQSSWP